jgi:hypothetical protein
MRWREAAASGSGAAFRAHPIRTASSGAAIAACRDQDVLLGAIVEAFRWRHAGAVCAAKRCYACYGLAARGTRA